MFISPEQIVKNLGIEPGMIVADFGSGTGHYTVEAAKLITKAGKVYSIDIQKEMLQTLKSRCEINGLENVEIIWADLELHEGTRLGTGLVDFVIISNILFQVDDKKAIAKEAHRIIKNTGKVAIIEWDMIESKIGPPMVQRISSSEITKIFEESGFSFYKNFEAGDNHYGLLFRKLEKNE